MRLVRHVASNGTLLVLITNLMDPACFATSVCGDFYHQRWNVEESFERLKHHLSSEHVAGLSPQEVEQDGSAKTLCDNLQALTAAAAHAEANIVANARTNHAYVDTALQPKATRLAAR